MQTEAEHLRKDAQPMKVICFDFGGVLVRISRSWEEACDKAGIDPTKIATASKALLSWYSGRRRTTKTSEQKSRYCYLP